jgi:hypothetical protein
MEFSRPRFLVPAFEPVAIIPMFTSPAATLAGIKDNPRWLVPLLVAAGYSLIVNLFVIQRIGFVRLMQAALQAGVSIDPQSVLDAAVARKTEILVFQGLSTCAGTLVTALVVSKVMWLILSLIGEDVSFKKVLSVEAHVVMLCAVLRGSMLAITASAIQDLNSFDLRNPLATNPGFFCRFGSPSVSRVMNALDLFTFAHILLLAVGLNKLTGRLSLRAAVILVTLAWGAYVGSTILLPAFP